MEVPDVQPVESEYKLFTRLTDYQATGSTVAQTCPPPTTYSGGAICAHEAPAPCSPPPAPVHEHGYETLRPLKLPKPTRKARRPACALRVQPRPRASRARRRVAARSSARSGDSGSDGPSAEVRLALRLADAGLSVGEAAGVVKDIISLHPRSEAVWLLRDRAAALETLAADWRAAAEAVVA